MVKSGATPRVVTVATTPAEGGYYVLLDAKPMRTPAGKPALMPNAALADAVAAEWRSAGARPSPARLPLTRLVSTALDRVVALRADVETQLMTYAETELVCHLADQPPDLVARQTALWQPLLDWLAQRHDALLAVTHGVIARPQAPAALAALRTALAGLDIWRLTALSNAVGASGSLVIGLALLDGRLDPETAFEAAELEASFEIEKWGADDEATARRAEVRADLVLAARFLSLLN